MNCENINFSSPAVQRMYERGIKKQSVVEVIKSGKIIASYPDDEPYPSFLMLGFENDTAIYLPKSDIWQAGFKKRRES